MANKFTPKEYNKREVDSYINQIKKSTLSFLDSTKLTARALQIISDTLARFSSAEQISREVVNEQVSSDFITISDSEITVALDKPLNNNYLWKLVDTGSDFGYNLTFEFDELNNNGATGTIIIQQDSNTETRNIPYLDYFIADSNVIYVDFENYTPVNVSGVGTDDGLSSITTSTAHGLAVGDKLTLLSLGGMIIIPTTIHTVTKVISSTEFVVDTLLSGTYTSGGTVNKKLKTLFITTTANEITVYNFRLFNGKIYLTREAY